MALSEPHIGAVALPSDADSTLSAHMKDSLSTCKPDERNPSLTPSTDRDALLKDLHGRTFNTTNKAYILPADVDEHARLDIQHEMHRINLSGLYWTTDHVRRILAPREEGGKPPTVLDIGTGSGVWAVDMAEEFPHAQVIGIDIVPANVSKTIPPNCRFECHDVNAGLPYPKGTFDVIHIRSVSAGLDDFKSFLFQLFDFLRPGGILLVVEADGMYNEQCQPATQEDERAPDFSWFAMMRNRARKYRQERLKSRGGVVLDAHGYQDWMKHMSIWEAQDHRKWLTPLGPWKPDMTEQDRRASELLRKNMYSVCASWRPALLNAGYPTKTIDEWIANARDEMANLKAHIYVGWQASWALKPEASG